MCWQDSPCLETSTAISQTLAGVGEPGDQTYGSPLPGRDDGGKRWVITPAMGGPRYVPSYQQQEKLDQKPVSQASWHLLYGLDRKSTREKAGTTEGFSSGECYEVQITAADPREMFSERIRQARIAGFGERGMTNCARACGKSLTTYRDYEKGAKPPYEYLRTFIEVTECNPVWLLTGFGSIDGPADKYGATGIREAEAKYGAEGSVEIIKDEAFQNLLDLLHVRDDQLKESKEDNEVLQLELRRALRRIGELEATQKGKNA